MSYSARQVLKQNATQVLGASQTLVPVSDEILVTGEGSRNCIVGLKVSGYSGTVTATLQHSLVSGVGANWRSDDTVSITGNSWFYIDHFAYTLNTVNTIKYPIGSIARVVITTGAASGVTVEQCLFLQDQG
jgi:hypothetical protein